MSEIRFGVWAPSKAVFVQSWLDAGIFDLDAETGDPRVAPAYTGIETNMASWDGLVSRTPGGVAVPGWHTNVVVYGPALIAQFTYGLPQTEVDGNLLSVWQRTHAATAFGLTYRDANAETGFPAGYQSAEGVTYADAAAFTSPANVF